MPCVESSVVSVEEALYADFLKQTKSSVATMVNTFERKKNAFNTKNATRKKTGALDMRRVANYRTSENIFAKKMISPNQKNHKIMILIDWSGSISSIIQPIIYQAINVAQFCKKTGVAFQVCAFVDNNYAKLHHGAKTEEPSQSIEMDDYHVVVEFLSDKMSQKEFNDGCRNLFLLGNRDIRDGRGDRYNYSEQSFFELNGTPLNNALVTVREMISEDRSKYDSYNLVVLTDGESAAVRSKKREYRSSWEIPDYIDGKTNKMYKGADAGVADNQYINARFNSVGETGFILGIIKKELRVKNFVFHFFNGKPQKEYSSKAVSNVDRQVFFLGDKHIKNVDEFFYVNAGALFNIEVDVSKILSDDEDEEIDWDNIDEDDDGIDFGESFKKIEKGASVNSIQKEFTKVLASEKIKRLVANALVTEICATYN